MKNAICNTCTIILVKKACLRAPWLRLVREPLLFGMVMMARFHRINGNEYNTRSVECRGCSRFLKTALKERSSLFRSLNALLNPLFDRVLELHLTENEVAESKLYAKNKTAPEAEAKIIKEPALNGNTR